MTDTPASFISNINAMYPNATLNDREVAAILGVHKETIYRMRKKGLGPPFVKIGKKVICIKEDFFEWFFSKYSKNKEFADTV
jgi:excisionase family DNA binding protein